MRRQATASHRITPRPHRLVSHVSVYAQPTMYCHVRPRAITKRDIAKHNRTEMRCAAAAPAPPYLAPSEIEERHAAQVLLAGMPGQEVLQLLQHNVPGGHLLRAVLDVGNGCPTVRGTKG